MTKHEHDWEYYAHIFNRVVQFELYDLIRVERCKECDPPVYRQVPISRVNTSTALFAK